MAEYIDRQAAIKKFCFATLDCLGMEPTILASDVAEALKSIPAADVVPASDFRDCRNELCLKCGAYTQKHNGACDGCRWRT